MHACVIFIVYIPPRALHIDRDIGMPADLDCACEDRGRCCWIRTSTPAALAIAAHVYRAPRHVAIVQCAQRAELEGMRLRILGAGRGQHTCTCTHTSTPRPYTYTYVYTVLF